MLVKGSTSRPPNTSSSNVPSSDDDRGPTLIHNGSVPSLSGLADGLVSQRYVADRGLLTAVRLALELGRPLLLEGEPGVGKTELAKALTAVLGRELIRVQCYEGLDASQALYEWNYPKQLLHVRGDGRDTDRASANSTDIYTDEFLLERPLLKAVRSSLGAVLLIDEIDRSDEQFEAFLLEFLSDFQVTIPERGTISAAVRPVVVLTSNRTRELHDALKRRCLYHWIDLPGPEREREILRMQVPGLTESAASSLVEAVTSIRRAPLVKTPGLAESIEWARGAQILEGDGDTWPVALRQSLGLLLKERDDVGHVVAHERAIFEDMDA
jgi:MoxR-like ATPase